MSYNIVEVQENEDNFGNRGNISIYICMERVYIEEDLRKAVLKFQHEHLRERTYCRTS